MPHSLLGENPPPYWKQAHSDAAKWLSQLEPAFAGANDHSIDHVDRVLEYIDRFLARFDPHPLSSEERALLAVATLYHDIGNVLRRKGHSRVSAELMLDLLADKETPFPVLRGDWVALIAKIIECHSSDTRITRVLRLDDPVIISNDVPVRGRALAALLRLCDELDEDQRRAPKHIMAAKRAAKTLPATSEAYWRFNQAVAGVDLSEAPQAVTLKLRATAAELRALYTLPDGRILPLSAFAGEKLEKIRNTIQYCNEFLPAALRVQHFHVILEVPDRAREDRFEWTSDYSIWNFFAEHIDASVLVSADSGLATGLDWIKEAVRDMTALCLGTLGERRVEVCLIGSAARCLSGAKPAPEPRDLDFLIVLPDPQSLVLDKVLGPVHSFMEQKYRVSVTLEQVSTTKLLTRCTLGDPFHLAAVADSCFVAACDFMHAAKELVRSDERHFDRATLATLLKEHAESCLLDLQDRSGAAGDVVAHRCLQAMWTLLQWYVVQNSPQDLTQSFLCSLAVPDSLRRAAVTVNAPPAVVDCFMSVREATRYGQKPNGTQLRESTMEAAAALWATEALQ
jgi:hypothetical protein